MVNFVILLASSSQTFKNVGTNFEQTNYIRKQRFRLQINITFRNYYKSIHPLSEKLSLNLVKS